MSKTDTELADPPPESKTKPGRPKRGHKRDRVAKYLVANDLELYTKGVRRAAVAASCECSIGTVRAGRARVYALGLFWHPRRWPKLRSAPLILLPKEWAAIRERLLVFADALPMHPEIGLRALSPDFAVRWISNYKKCAGLTVATVAAAGRSIGWKW